MKISKAESGVNVSLNDSDDAFISPGQKRKLKPASPKTKRCRVVGKNELSHRTLSNSPNLLKKGRKPPMNRSDPVLPTKRSKRFDAAESSGSSKSSKTSSSPTDVSSSDVSPSRPSCKETSNILVTNEEISCSPVPKSDATIMPKETAPKIDGKQNQQDLSKFFKTSRANKSETLVCPLCLKKFETSFSHVSHMKQCAKKKKIPTAHLLRAIEENKEKAEASISKSHHSEILPTSTVPERDTEATETAYQLAITTAISLSLNKSSVVGLASAADRKVVDSQKTTLEKFGFTNTAAKSGSGSRRGKALKPVNSVLRSRTNEERLRLLTEKAAVILLADQDAMLRNDRGTPMQRNEEIEKEPRIGAKVDRMGSNTMSTQGHGCLPHKCQETKLWLLGGNSENGPWYLEGLKDHIFPENMEKESSNGKLSAAGPNISTTEINQRSDTTSEADASISLVEDWGKLVGNSLWSDASLQTKDGEVPIHSLVLRARCGGLEPSQVEASCLQATSSALLFVLRFIYTGVFGDIKKSDIDTAEKLAGIFRRPDFISILRAQHHSNSSSDDIIPSSLSPLASVRDNTGAAGGFETCATGSSETCVAKDLTVNADRVSVDEADTVPVSPGNPTLDEAMDASEIVDLTQSGCGSPRSWCSDPAERSYWNMVRRELDQELREEQELEQDRQEHAQELAKIQSFIEQQSSVHLSIADDHEEDRREMEKIYNLSRSSNNMEADLFDDNVEVEVVSNSPKPPAEVIVVSSDSESGNFEDSTDEEVIPPVSPQNQTFDEAFSVPFFESPECDVFIDYTKKSTLASQSLVAAAVSPRTPRKVLGSTPKTVSPVASTARKGEELVTEGGSPATLPEPGPSCSNYPTTPLAACDHVTASPETRSGPSRKRRRSAVQQAGTKIVRRSVRSLNGRGKRSARRSLLPETSAATQPEEIELLSNSVIAALDESWRKISSTVPGTSGKVGTTPTTEERPFTEITPRFTPSVKLVDKATPRPNFSAMKTGSLKKHLQKYGLKKSLGKVKARKILRHIYEELHPVLNTKTGKLVKFLPGEPTAVKGGKVVTRGVCRGRGGKVATRGSKITTLGRKGDADAGARKKVATTSLTTTSEPFAGPSSDGGEGDTNLESNLTSNTEGESDEDRSEFSSEEDEVLTQCSKPTISVDEAVTKYITEHIDFHAKILAYEPIWVEALRRDIHATYQMKYRIADIMDFLDRKCITFRSELQSANNRKRNERKKQRKTTKNAAAASTKLN